ncbi:MAG TPA: ROK family glucokinase [Actinomycetota bacterium]|nr:ROK family glucokinase [Actinomycetota bacterium]
MANGTAVGIDVGGSRMAGALVDLDRGGQVLERRELATPSLDPDAVVGGIVSLARELAAGGVAAVGVAAAGMVDRRGVMRYAPNIAWREFPLAERVRAEVGLPVRVENDATAAAWGEFRFGAGRGVRDLLLVTVGTGIGGGIVLDGELVRGAHGFAAEVGHIVVEPDGPRCGCGNRGCWEQVASGRTIARLGREAARERLSREMLELAGGDPERVTGEVVTQAGRAGDPVALRILTEVGRRLGQGIAGLVNVLDPELVVVGGGAAEAGDLLLGPAREAFAEAVEGSAHRPAVPIVPAALGNDAGAVGAADLAAHLAGGGG